MLRKQTSIACNLIEQIFNFHIYVFIVLFFFFVTFDVSYHMFMTERISLRVIYFFSTKKCLYLFIEITIVLH